MVFEYAEHDFLVRSICLLCLCAFLLIYIYLQQVIHHHSQVQRGQIPTAVLKSLIYQLLNGLVYLHSCHILHRDLKPANILITSSGVVKIADLGLARLIYQPLQALFIGDKVVVTIWYRAPELLMGAKHYHKAVDCWAVGCVMAELASLRPIFKGEEAKLDSKKNVPFQKDQLLRIFEVLGTPKGKLEERRWLWLFLTHYSAESDWPGVVDMPEYDNMKRLDMYAPSRSKIVVSNLFYDSFEDRLANWCRPTNGLPVRIDSEQGYNLLRDLFAYDPDKRLTAKDALQHKWFHEDPLPTWKFVPTPTLSHCTVYIEWSKLYPCSLVHSRLQHQNRSRHIGVSRKTKRRLWCLYRRPKRRHRHRRKLMFRRKPTSPSRRVLRVLLVWAVAAGMLVDRVGVGDMRLRGRRRE